MKIWISLLLIAALPFSFSSCGGDDFSTVASEMEGHLVEITTILQGITDKESVQASQPRLEAVAKKMANLSKRFDALGKPSQADQELIDSATGSAIDDLMIQWARVASEVPGGKDALESVKTAMSRLRK